ncbi:MAG TPA: phosphoribosylformylglycinamidine synthase subunit PurQ [bacterium]|nr:phosphoribosylformylglycinamidine synthase subunit PurQ [bacterium]
MEDLRAIVIAGNGTNCEMEMAHACRLGGFEQVDIVFIHDILSGEVDIRNYHLLCLPGGFLDGDDLGSAKAAAVTWRYSVLPDNRELADALFHFIENDKLIIGVCNGFQLLVKLGLLPALDMVYFKQEVTLTFNDSGRFEDRWAYLVVNEKSPCVFTKGLDKLYLPVRHGEGKLIAGSKDILREMKNRNLIAMQYAGTNYEPTMKYPANPNGSEEAIAALCDETGRIFGLMPHPEAYLHYTNFPRWQRFKTMPEEGLGVPLFRNAYNYLRKSR